MEPSQIFMEVCNTTPPLEVLPFAIGAWSREHMDPELMPNNASEEGFINGVRGDWPACFYTMRGGEAADPTSGQMVLSLTVLKYENTEFAEKSFIDISTADELRDSIYKGIALKIGFHSLAPWEEIWGVTVVPCYLIQSDCFVIYIYGREDAANDMLDRIIVAFGVKEQNIEEVGMKSGTLADSTVLATSSGVEDGSNMSIGTEVVLGNSAVTTYLGKTSNGNNKWQATFEGPKYLDDLQTPIDCRWEYDIDRIQSKG